MATERYLDLMRQGFMKPTRTTKTKRAPKPKPMLFVLHHNWTGDWKDSAKFAFHASGPVEAKKMADRWARHHGFGLNEVGVEMVSSYHHYGVQLHDEYMT